jgi:hypothetical protein
MQPQFITEPPEEWRPVVGFEGFYEVSDLGQVRRVGRIADAQVGRILAARGGLYQSVMFGPYNHPTQHNIHRLVAEAFLGPCPAGHECNHIDGIKTHNRFTNLEWVTPAQNSRHASVTGLVASGERHGRAKLTEADVLAIRAEGGKVTQQTLANQYGVDRATISYIQARKTWRHI